MGLAHSVVVMRAQTDQALNQEIMHGVVNQSWQIDAVAERHCEFLNRFLPIERAVKRQKFLDMQWCFELRTLLIYEYRRILMHDADLAPTLLRCGWPGTTATWLAGRIYQPRSVPCDTLKRRWKPQEG